MIPNVGEVEQICPLVWKWTVKNCNQYAEASRLEVLSPKFAIEQSNQTTNWRLGCIANMRLPRKSWLVHVENFEQTDVIAGIKWSVSSIRNPSTFRSTRMLIFSKSSSKNYVMSIKGCDYQNFDQDNLVLHCCIIVDSGPILRAPDEVDCSAVLDDFEKLLDNNKHSDVMLILPRNKKINAHKAILSSRSPVFEAMFEHDMKEKQLNTVKITDVKYKIMKELLRFIYAGRVEDIDSISRELLVAADKYCIDKLKVLCENSIFKQVNIDNATEMLQLAITYNTAVLRSKVYEYTVEHIKDICKKPEFKQLDPVIKDELIAILADKI